MICQTGLELAGRLPPAGRLLGIDHGEKTLGLALSDERRSVASPLITLRRTKFTKDAEDLWHLIDEHQVVGLVFGWPLEMDGRIGPRCQSVRAFATRLLHTRDLPLLLWDERLSTSAVTRTLIEADRSRARREVLVDKMAACYILQGALDGLGALRP